MKTKNNGFTSTAKAAWHRLESAESAELAKASLMAKNSKPPLAVCGGAMFDPDRSCSNMTMILPTSIMKKVWMKI